MAAFIIWALGGAAFICLGIYTYRSNRSRPFGFWANAEQFPVQDPKAYNKALGKLWCAYGGILIVLGTPLLAGQNSPYILLSVIGTLFASIAVMVIYTIIIEPKYRKK